MNLHLRLLGVGTNATDATSYTFSPANAPVSGRPVRVYVASAVASDTANTPTLTGTNAYNTTWTQEGTVTVDQVRLTAFRAVAASSVNGNVVPDFGGQTQIAGWFKATEGMNAGTGAAVQVRSANTNAGTTLNFDLDNVAVFNSVWNVLEVVGFAQGNFLLPRSSDTQGLLHTISVQGVSSADGGINSWVAPTRVQSPALTTAASADILALALEWPHDGSDTGAGGGVPLTRVTNTRM